MKVHSPAQLSISPRFSTGHPTNRWTRYSAPCFLVLLHPPPSVASPDRSRSKPERLTMTKHRWNGSFPRKRVTRLDILFVLPIFLIQSFPRDSTKQCIGIWSSLTSNRLALMPKPWVVFPITVNTLLANLGCSILGTPPLQIYFEAMYTWLVQPHGTNGHTKRTLSVSQTFAIMYHCNRTETHYHFITAVEHIKLYKQN